MEMKVENRLPGSRSAEAGHGNAICPQVRKSFVSKALRDSCARCNIQWVCINNVGSVTLWNNQAVTACRWAYVHERQSALILVNHSCGDVATDD